MAKTQNSKEAAAAKFTSECQESLAEVEQGEQVTVLLRTKLKSHGDAAAHALVPLDEYAESGLVARPRRCHQLGIRSVVHEEHLPADAYI